MTFLSKAKNGIAIRIQVQPRAAKEEVAGVHGEAVKIRLTAPPVGGAANKALIKWISKALSVPKSSLVIDAGESARSKRVIYRVDDAADISGEIKRISSIFDQLIKNKING